ncbi:hypothetical protein BKA70DRAFT_1451912 [Coprinopsis sp. MPI-PUGE-AT-0042]|nr:hypothetical protein BKA70DRAFT_1451912 [Coprinopsis sp. MPI-PUGE-AT-0042]
MAIELSALYGVQIALSLGYYTQDVLKKLFNPSAEISLKTLEPRMMAECRQLAQIVAKAWQNTVCLPFSLRNYTFPKHDQSRLLRPICSPAVFIDQDGIIVWWYLPGIFQAHRHTTIIQAVRKLAFAQHTCLQTSEGEDDWRSHSSFYTSHYMERPIKEGLADFEIAHTSTGFNDEVSVPFTEHVAST